MLVEPPETLLTELRTRYSEPQRAYHTWQHIEALLSHFRRHQSKLDDPTRVLWAMYWHDAIYDPRASDNELRSAELLRKQAQDFLTETQIEQAAQIIEATEKHFVPDDVDPALRNDLELFLDLDLSILAQNSEVFAQYEKDIRTEYIFVPEERYREARSGVLSGFLKRHHIYFNRLLREAWEVRARENLAQSIATLTDDEPDLR